MVKEKTEVQLICDAAGITLEPHGKWPTRDCRKCDNWSSLLVAVAATLQSQQRSHDAEVKRLTATNTELCQRSSDESAKRAAMAEKLSKTEHIAIGRGMAAEEIPEATRNRILNVNGG